MTAARRALASLEEITHLLAGALARSTADETELVWLEILRGRAEARGNRARGDMLHERTLLVRVIERGRVGSYRTGSGEPGDLDNAIRQAVAQSRVREPLAGLPHLPAEGLEVDGGAEIFDRQIAELSPESAGAHLAERLHRGESAEIRWSEARVAVFNSRAVRRKAAVTAVQATVASGNATATAAGRRLADVAIADLCELARSRGGERDRAPLPEEPLRLALSPEATSALIDLLNEASFSAKAYYDGTSFLREHLGVQVFDRALHLRDDATDAAGMPFPFDLEGTPKRPVDLIRDGIPKTPTLDQRQAAILGLPPTAHAIGGNNARAEHLFLEAGELSDEELLQAADGGLWIGRLTHIETLDPQRLQFRARARGVRRIEQGRLGRSVADLHWEDSLLRAFADLGGIGRQTRRHLSADGFFGGTSTPGLVLEGVQGLAGVA